jgi:hypothetical protein
MQKSNDIQRGERPVKRAGHAAADCSRLRISLDSAHESGFDAHLMNFEAAIFCRQIYGVNGGVLQLLGCGRRDISRRTTSGPRRSQRIECSAPVAAFLSLLSQDKPIILNFLRSQLMQ